jgi:hypothetical protein
MRRADRAQRLGHEVDVALGDAGDRAMGQRAIDETGVGGVAGHEQERDAAALACQLQAASPSRSPTLASDMTTSKVSLASASRNSAREATTRQSQCTPARVAIGALEQQQVVGVVFDVQHPQQTVVVHGTSHAREAVVRPSTQAMLHPRRPEGLRLELRVGAGLHPLGG